MSFNYRTACSISLDDHVVITGGSYTQKIVSRYNENGWVEDLPSLTQGRFQHGCTAFMSAGEQVRLTTWCRTWILNSAILRCLWSLVDDIMRIVITIPLTPLSSSDPALAGKRSPPPGCPVQCMEWAWQLWTTESSCLVSIVDNNIIHCCISLKLTRVTGGRTYAGRGYRADILEYKDSDGWRNLQTMKRGRAFHGTSLVDFNDFEENCN